MNCPECGGIESRVRSSLVVAGGRRRYRECVDCGCRYVTVEVLRDEYDRSVGLVGSIAGWLDTCPLTEDQ